MMLCKPFVFLLLALLLVDILLVDHVTAWSGRRRSSRRRRRYCATASNTRPTGVNWVNKWDQYAYFGCSSGNSVSRILSVHNNCVEDRIWYFECESNFAATSCFWTVPVNSYDGLMDFKCPHNGFIAGVESWHVNTGEDRQFRFRCCHNHNYKRIHCTYSSVTAYDARIDFITPYRHYLAGAWSSHSNYHEDRKWKFYTCQKEYTG